jgi:hypothetical protein
MNDIILKYEKIVSSKTVFTELMEKEAYRYCCYLYAQNNQTLVSNRVVNDWAIISNRGAAIAFEDMAQKDCMTIKQSAISKIDNQELIYYKVKVFQEILTIVNSLLSKIEIMLTLLGLKNGDLTQNFYEELSNFLNPSIIEKFIENSENGKHTPLDINNDILSREVFIEKMTKNKDNILFTQPLLYCYYKFYTVTIELGERYMAILGSVLVPTEFYFDNGLKKIYFNYKNPHFTKQHHTALNLEKEKVEPVYQGLKMYVSEEHHELLKLFLNQEPIEGHIEFEGDLLKLLDTFYRLLSDHWITKHTNDTLFYLIQSKFMYYDKRVTKPAHIIDNESQRKLAIRTENYLAKGEGVEIEGLPYRVKKNRQPIPKNSSQKK